MSDLKNRSLSQLCQEYVWWVLVGWDMEGFDYTGNQQRMAIHGRIGEILGIDDPNVGFLKWALNTLEGSAGLPDMLPEREDWEAVSKRCGLALRRRLVKWKDSTGTQ